MASNTYKTKMKRKKKIATKGKRRKKADKNKGSTPKFAIHQK